MAIGKRQTGLQRTGKFVAGAQHTGGCAAIQGCGRAQHKIIVVHRNVGIAEGCLERPTCPQLGFEFRRITVLLLDFAVRPGQEFRSYRNPASCKRDVAETYRIACRIAQECIEAVAPGAVIKELRSTESQPRFGRQVHIQLRAHVLRTPWVRLLVTDQIRRIAAGIGRWHSACHRCAGSGAWPDHDFILHITVALLIGVIEHDTDALADAILVDHAAALEVVRTIAALDGKLSLGRRPGDDVDDPAHGAAAIEGREWPRHDLDALDGLGWHRFPSHRTDVGIIEGLSVHQHQRPGIIGNTAHDDIRTHHAGFVPARTLGINPRQIGQRLIRRMDVHIFNFFGSHHAYRGRCIHRILGGLGRGDHHIAQ